MGKISTGKEPILSEITLLERLKSILHGLKISSDNFRTRRIRKCPVRQGFGRDVNKDGADRPRCISGLLQRRPFGHHLGLAPWAKSPVETNFLRGPATPGQSVPAHVGKNMRRYSSLYGMACGRVQCLVALVSLWVMSWTSCAANNPHFTAVQTLAPLYRRFGETSPARVLVFTSCSRAKLSRRLNLCWVISIPLHCGSCLLWWY